MAIRMQEVKTIEKIHSTFDSYEWYELSPDITEVEEIYNGLEYPEEAERKGDLFYSNIQANLIAVLGTYYTRFYHEEDKYTMEKRYFISIFTKRPESKCLMTVSDREYVRYHLKISYSFENIVAEMYDAAYRKAYNVDDILDDFLNDEI